jgi:uncharacterized membrane protein (DUF485 family)
LRPTLSPLFSTPPLEACASDKPRARFSMPKSVAKALAFSAFGAIVIAFLIEAFFPALGIGKVMTWGVLALTLILIVFVVGCIINIGINDCYDSNNR